MPGEPKALTKAAPYRSDEAIVTADLVSALLRCAPLSLGTGSQPSPEFENLNSGMWRHSTGKGALGRTLPGG